MSQTKLKRFLLMSQFNLIFWSEGEIEYLFSLFFFGSEYRCNIAHLPSSNNQSIKIVIT